MTYNCSSKNCCNEWYLHHHSYLTLPWRLAALNYTVTRQQPLSSCNIILCWHNYRSLIIVITSICTQCYRRYELQYLVCGAVDTDCSNIKITAVLRQSQYSALQWRDLNHIIYQSERSLGLARNNPQIPSGYHQIYA